MKENLVINPEITDNNEEKLETTLRPQMLDEYIGQTKVKEKMIKMQKNITNLLHLAKSFDFSN